VAALLATLGQAPTLERARATFDPARGSPDGNRTDNPDFSERNSDMAFEHAGQRIGDAAKAMVFHRQARNTAEVLRRPNPKGASALRTICVALRADAQRHRIPARDIDPPQKPQARHRYSVPGHLRSFLTQVVMHRRCSTPARRAEEPASSPSSASNSRLSAAPSTRRRSRSPWNRPPPSGVNRPSIPIDDASRQKKSPPLRTSRQLPASIARK
jgi:hypothetical protein